MSSKKAGKSWLADEQLPIDSFFGSASKPNVATDRRPQATKRKQNAADAMHTPQSVKKVKTSKQRDDGADFSPAPSSSKAAVVRTPAPRRPTLSDITATHRLSGSGKTRGARTAIHTPVTVTRSSATKGKAKKVQGLFTPHPDAEKAASGSSNQSVILISSDGPDSDPVVPPSPKPQHSSRTALTLQTPPATLLLRPIATRKTKMAPPPMPLRIVVPLNKASDPMSLSPLSSPPPEVDEAGDAKRLPLLSSLIQGREVEDPTALKAESGPSKSAVIEEEVHSSQIELETKYFAQATTPSKNLEVPSWEVPSSQSQYLTPFKASQHPSSSPIASRCSGHSYQLVDVADVEVPSSQSQYLTLKPFTFTASFLDQGKDALGTISSNDTFTKVEREIPSTATTVLHADEVPSSQADHDGELTSPVRTRVRLGTKDANVEGTELFRDSIVDKEDMDFPSEPSLTIPASPPPDSTNPSSTSSSTQMSATQTDSQYSQMARLTMPFGGPSACEAYARIPQAHSQMSATQTDSQYSQLGRIVIDGGSRVPQMTNTATQMSATQTDSQYSQMAKEKDVPSFDRRGDTLRIGTGTQRKSKIELYAVRRGDGESSVTLSDSDEEEDPLRLDDVERLTNASKHSVPPSTVPSSPTRTILSSPHSQIQNSMPALFSQDDALLETTQGTITPRRLRRMVRAFRDSGGALGTDEGPGEGGGEAEEARRFLEIFGEGSQSQGEAS